MGPVETEQEKTLFEQLRGKHVDKNGQVRPLQLMTEFNKCVQEEWRKYKDGHAGAAPSLRFKELKHITAYINQQAAQCAAFVHAAFQSQVEHQRQQGLLHRTAPPQPQPPRAPPRQLNITYPPRPYTIRTTCNTPGGLPR